MNDKITFSCGNCTNEENKSTCQNQCLAKRNQYHVQKTTDFFGLSVDALLQDGRKPCLTEEKERINRRGRVTYFDDMDEFMEEHDNFLKWTKSEGIAIWETLETINGRIAVICIDKSDNDIYASCLEKIDKDRIEPASYLLCIKGDSDIQIRIKYHPWSKEEPSNGFLLYQFSYGQNTEIKKKWGTSLRVASRLRSDLNIREASYISPIFDLLRELNYKFRTAVENPYFIPILFDFYKTEEDFERNTGCPFGKCSEYGTAAIMNGYYVFFNAVNYDFDTNTVTDID